ncbi:serine/threonine-protein kinase ppk4-like [Lingula anatina]|uniref:Serine/threonine-protein kinase ppk4-like n=1 Tax=Lingula anatina TaxID=7574 RepID=A0A1S3HWD4_LINAN|nr:serine/threonine-protein kinase ppk4-like [Lingula anatina]|eukprot:XP_013390328.1 serine/threonine-protein kinase ppk4-like [Lingula anatina]
MEEYGLHEGAVVTVDWSVTVLVTFGEKSCSYILRSSYSVGQLKELLAVDTGLHRFEQHLGFYGTVLSDEKMLSEYLTPETEDKMSITLTCQPWKVLVLLPSGTLKDYKISPNTKVAFLKSQIEEHENIPVARQILQIDQNDLADDGLLCESMIPSNSILYLKEQIALKYSSNWTPVSARWKPCFEELLQVSDGNLKEVNNVCFSTKVDRFKIGFGNKTEVFLGIRHDGREVAVKRFPRSMSQNFKNEKSVLTTLDSPNIIRYLDIAMDDEFLYLILELGEFTLNEFISTDEYKQNQTNISRDLVGQILESLRTLHTGHNVIHMDIKPHNVLLDVSNRAKLSDFGISVVLPDNQSTFYTTAKGTYHWVAKEILDSATGKVKYKKNADIQVAGMLVYYTLTGGIHPFMPNGEADVFLCNKNVQDGKHDLSALDDIVGRHLVDWMLQPDPELRPTIEEALAHPFFWNVDMRYRFLGVLGDEKEVKESWKRQPHSVTLTLDGLTVSVFNTVPHWKDLLDQAVYDEVSKPVRNGYRSTICGLLRFIRNVDVHLKDQPPAIQATVGNPMTYFTAKLPFDELFLRVYKTVRDTRSSADDWTVRGSLKEFFPA